MSIVQPRLSMTVMVCDDLENSSYLLSVTSGVQLMKILATTSVVGVLKAQKT